MSASTSWAHQPEIETIAGDRRGDRRYDLRLEMRWKLIRRRRVLDQGAGRTLDVSSGGIFFDAGRPLPSGLNVELSISWPVLLHNVAPLQLMVSGKIVRAEGSRTAIRISQHEFRTVGIPADHRSLLADASRAPVSILRASGPGLSNIH
jgi:hypothetical protein